MKIRRLNPKFNVIARSRRRRSNLSLRLLRSARNDGQSISRSEINEQASDFQKQRELEHWFLWTGLSPASQMPVSQIGIYTDFT